MRGNGNGMPFILERDRGEAWRLGEKNQMARRELEVSIWRRKRKSERANTGEGDSERAM